MLSWSLWFPKNENSTTKYPALMISPYVALSAHVTFPHCVTNRFLVRCRRLKRVVQRTTAKQTHWTWPLSTRYQSTSLPKYHKITNHKIMGLLLLSCRFPMRQGRWNWPKSPRRVRLPRTCWYVTTASSWTMEPTARSLSGKVRGLNKLNTTLSMKWSTHAVSCGYRKITNGSFLFL